CPAGARLQERERRAGSYNPSASGPANALPADPICLARFVHCQVVRRLDGAKADTKGALDGARAEWEIRSGQSEAGRRAGPATPLPAAAGRTEPRAAGHGARAAAAREARRGGRGRELTRSDESPPPGRPHAPRM